MNLPVAKSALSSVVAIIVSIVAVVSVTLAPREE